MKKVVILLVCLFVFPLSLMAEDYMAQISDLCDKGGVENSKKAMDIALKAVNANPNSYEANAAAARAVRTYADYYKREAQPEWKETCRVKGKLAMQYAEKAFTLQPKRVEGYYWYGCSVGTYADGVSVFTALAEGLKGKTQNAFDKAYAIDKMYHNGGPMKAIAHFWQIIPFPFTDKKLALTYIREFNKSFPNDPEGLVFFGQILIANGLKDEAKGVLQKAVASPDKYYSAEAQKAVATL